MWLAARVAAKGLLPRGLVRYGAPVFWLERPPYVRWVAAALLLAGAAAMDLTERAESPFPFVVSALAGGEPITPGDVEWRNVPTGLLGRPATPRGVAAHDLDVGDPLVAGAVADASAVPTGWWSVPIELPESASVGDRVRLVSLEPALDVEGVVAQPSQSSAFSTRLPGLVAVPHDRAGSVARAAGSGRLVVLLGT